MALGLFHWNCPKLFLVMSQISLWMFVMMKSRRNSETKIFFRANISGDFSGISHLQTFPCLYQLCNYWNIFYRITIIPKATGNCLAKEFWFLDKISSHCLVQENTLCILQINWYWLDIFDENILQAPNVEIWLSVCKKFQCSLSFIQFTFSMFSGYW